MEEREGLGVMGRVRAGESRAAPSQPSPFTAHPCPPAWRNLAEVEVRSRGHEESCVRTAQRVRLRRGWGATFRCFYSTAHAARPRSAEGMGREGVQENLGLMVGDLSHSAQIAQCPLAPCSLHTLNFEHRIRARSR